MKRIKELQILILKDIRDFYTPGGIMSSAMSFEGYTADEISYNLRLLINEGYVKIWSDTTTHGDSCRTYLIDMLTTRGHNLIED